MNAHRIPLRLIASLFAGLLMLPICQAQETADSIETILMVRHGEKPAAGLGQLTCQGLNRALALPHVIEQKYGRPDTVFAPDPAQPKTDHGVIYDYVRPLATVEPAAIYFGLPVQASISFTDIERLKSALLAPKYQRSTVLVGWEHTEAQTLVRQIVAAYGGDPAKVPDWSGSDFDSIYVLRIKRHEGKIGVAFSIDHEGLDNSATACPNPATPGTPGSLQ